MQLYKIIEIVGLSRPLVLFEFFFNHKLISLANFDHSVFVYKTNQCVSLISIFLISINKI